MTAVIQVLGAGLASTSARGQYAWISGQSLAVVLEELLPWKKPCEMRMEIRLNAHVHESSKVKASGKSSWR